MTATPLHSAHSVPLVILALAIAVVASYTALGLVMQAKRSYRGFRNAWILGGGLCMGTGVWAMHFVAMLALRLGIPYSFQLSTTLISLAAGVLGSIVSFLVVSGRVRMRFGQHPVLLGGVLLGGSMAVMHYVGMKGLRLQADLVYHAWAVVGSVIVAVGGSCLALLMAFGPKGTRSAVEWNGMMAAALLGATVGALHFAAMNSVSYFPNPALPVPTDAERDWLAILVSLAVFAIFLIGLVSRALDQRSYAWLTNTLESITQGFSSFDREWRYTYVNAAAEEMFGLKREDLLGKVMWEVLPNIEGNRFHQMFQKAIDEQRPIHFTEFFPQRSMWFNVSAYPMPDGISIYYQDVTREVQFRQLQETLVANVSHDLRAPIASIRATLEALHDGVVPVERRTTYLGSALRELDRMSRMTDDLLHLSRLDSGTLVLHRERLSLEPLLEETRDAWVPRFDAAGVGLEVDMPDYVVVADYDQVARVLSNLLDNALKFTSVGGSVRLFCESDDRFVRINVSDTGAGIPEQDLPFIWDRFYTADRARTRNNSSGSGLGLTIAKKLVEQMGGSITVRSQLWQGTIFSFTLPRVQ